VICGEAKKLVGVPSLGDLSAEEHTPVDGFLGLVVVTRGLVIPPLMWRRRQGSSYRRGGSSRRAPELCTA